MFSLRFTCCAIVVVVLTLPGSLCSSQDQPTATGSDSAQYVGAEVCQGCHADSYDTFRKSAHLKTLKRERVAEQGCEGCHGPGAEHVKSGGDPNQIVRYTDVKPASILGRCQRCHLHDIGGPHTTAGLSCLTCHSAHHLKQLALLLVKPSLQLCRGCTPPNPPHRRCTGKHSLRSGSRGRLVTYVTPKCESTHCPSAHRCKQWSCSQWCIRGGGWF